VILTQTLFMKRKTIDEFSWFSRLAPQKYQG